MTLRQPLKTFAFDASYFRAIHQAILPFDVTLDEIVVPAYWGMVAAQLREGSIIECHRPDWSLDVMLRVIRVEKGLAVVHYMGGFFSAASEAEVRALKAQGAPTNTAVEMVMPDALAEDYKIGHTPTGFYVQYKPTKETIKTGLASKAAAITFAVEHNTRAHA